MNILGAHKPSNWHMSPNCWYDISNTNIWIQLTCIPIGYKPPTFGEYMSVEFIYWYWIYPANYRGIYVSWRVSAPGPNSPGPNFPPWKSGQLGPGAQLSGAQLSTFSGWTIGPRTVGPWGRNPPTDIYPPIVGRIYPIPVYEFNWHVFPKCWQLISNTNIKIKNIYIKEPCAQTANTHPLMYNFNWIIFPTCWQFISSTKFTFPNPAPKGFTETLQLTYIFLIFGRIYPIQIYILWYLYLYSDLRNTCQLYLYILVLDISCQKLGEMSQSEGFCAPRNLVTFGNIYICMGYMLTTFGEYTSVGGFLCALRTQS